jgi:hypothetical protein
VYNAPNSASPYAERVERHFGAVPCACGGRCLPGHCLKSTGSATTPSRRWPCTWTACRRWPSASRSNRILRDSTSAGRSSPRVHSCLPCATSPSPATHAASSTANAISTPSARPASRRDWPSCPRRGMVRRVPRRQGRRHLQGHLPGCCAAAATMAPASASRTDGRKKYCPCSAAPSGTRAACRSSRQTPSAPMSTNSATPTPTRSSIAILRRSSRAPAPSSRSSPTRCRAWPIPRGGS